MSNPKVCSELILPRCSSYHIDRQIFNRSIQTFPAGILYCKSEGDVAWGISHAVQCGLTVRIRSGGHNYEGFCVGDGVLVIDTSRLKNLSICERSNTVCIGSGVNNAELYAALGEYGYPFPSGTCPTVNAVGLTQGGGWGRSARMFGLTCDSLLEASLVDAGGHLLIANEDSHPDLFWALRGGGGGNFGVVTALKYRLPAKLFDVTYVDIRYTGISKAAARRFFDVWQQWLHSDDIRFTPNSRIFNSADEGLGIYLRGIYYGTPQEAERSVAPFLALNGAEASFQAVSFLEATQIDAAFYPSSEQFRFAGCFVYDDFSQSKIDSILSLISSRPKGATSVSVALYALGGKIRDTAPRDTAFFYRNSSYIIGIEAIWADVYAKQESLKWLAPRARYLQSLTDGSYVNFPYLHTGHYMTAYYGGNARRLIDVKSQYDHTNLFCFPQSIPVNC